MLIPVLVVAVILLAVWNWWERRQRVNQAGEIEMLQDRLDKIEDAKIWQAENLSRIQRACWWVENSPDLVLWRIRRSIEDARRGVNGKKITKEICSRLEFALDAGARRDDIADCLREIDCLHPSKKKNKEVLAEEISQLKEEIAFENCPP